MFDFDIPSLEWREVYIPKHNNNKEFRKITIPNDELKELQRQILSFLYKNKKVKLHPAAHGFRRFRNTITGALTHWREAERLLGMDVKDFFDNFPLKPVEEGLIEAGIPAGLVSKIMQVATYKGRLPQGGPLSPMLTNIGMYKADLRISAYASACGLTYSRYADDIVLGETKDSNLTCTGQVFKTIGNILYEEFGLKLNEEKSHIMELHGSTPRRITGVVVRKDGLGYNAPRRMRKDTRMRLHFLYLQLNEKPEVTPEQRQEWRELCGRIQYMNAVRSASSPEVAGDDPMIDKKKFEFVKAKMEGKNGPASN